MMRLTKYGRYPTLFRIVMILNNLKFYSRPFYHSFLNFTIFKTFSAIFFPCLFPSTQDKV